MGPWAAGGESGREREKNSQPLRTKGRHPLANLPRCATPGQSEAAHTIFQHRVAGQSNHGAQVPSRLGWRGWRRRRLPQTGEVMMGSSEDERKDWPVAGTCFLPHPILSRHPRKGSGRNRRRSLANGQHDARLSRPGAVSGQRKGGPGVLWSCAEVHLPISRPQDQRPRRMVVSQEMQPGAAPKLSWLARRLFLWTAATGGEYSWELESRNNDRAYSPCARLFSL